MHYLARLVLSDSGHLVELLLMNDGEAGEFVTWFWSYPNPNQWGNLSSHHRKKSIEVASNL